MRIIKTKNVVPLCPTPFWWERSIGLTVVEVKTGKILFIKCQIFNWILVEEVKTNIATKLIVVKKAQSSKTKKVGVKNSKKNAK